MRSHVFGLGMLALAACGDDGGKGSVDARIIVGDTGGGDSGPVVCAATADYGTIATPLNPIAFRDVAVNPENVFYAGTLNADAVYDDLTIDLYSMTSVFTGQIVPLTVQLNGDEANFATCGACVSIQANVDPVSFESEMQYFVVGGVLTLTSVSPNITGTITNAMFVHTTTDMDTLETTPVGDGCAATVASFSFDTPVVTDMAFAPNDQRARHRLRKLRR
jgi:hypothetical protein